MFSFFKRFFQEEKKEVEIKVSELEEFYKEHSSAFMKKLHSDIEQVRLEADQGRKKAAEQIIRLEEAKLHNPNVPVKAIQFMEGNRQAFNRKVQLLLDGFEVPKDIDDIKEFSEQKKEEIENFLKTTQKSYQVLQEFFSHESGDLAYTIKGFEKLATDVGNLADSIQLKKIQDAKEKLDSLQSYLKGKKDMAKELMEKKTSMDVKRKKLSEVIVEKDSLLKSKGYSDLKKLKEEVIRIDNDSRSLEAELRHNFAVLDKALKKYSRVALENTDVIKAYLDHPVRALLSDEKLVILTVFESLEKSMRSLNLADKKHEKTKNTIKDLDKSYLEKKRKELHGLRSKLEDLTKKIKDDKVNMALSSLDEKKDNLEKEISACDHRIKAISSKEDRTGSLKEDVAGSFQEAFGIEIRIL